MKIIDANLKIIKDSRVSDTLEAALYAEQRGLNADNRGIISATASCPSGKSRGAHEAFVMEPNLAIEKFNKIKSAILAGEFENQKDFDDFLLKLDGTPNKQNLGGNLMLVLSLAFARLLSQSMNFDLYHYLCSLSRLPMSKYQTPRPFFNVINGGAHATNSQSKLDFQEFQIIPETNDFGMALGMGQEFYTKLKDFLENKFGKGSVMLGDEAGFSCPFENNEQALEIMADLILKNNYPLKIGLDVAATQFYKDGNYLVGGKIYSAEELKIFYLKLIDSYGIFSIEDPFFEEGFEDFADLLEDRPETLIITDDLTTTNLQRLQNAIDKKSGNAILIKPNQIGTLTETLDVIKLAYKNNWQTVISHRSGETMDDFIADLAVGAGAFGIKSGAPGAPERMAKYNRILEIINGN